MEGLTLPTNTDRASASSRFAFDPAVPAGSVEAVLSEMEHNSVSQKKCNHHNQESQLLMYCECQIVQAFDKNKHKDWNSLLVAAIE